MLRGSNLYPRRLPSSNLKGLAAALVAIAFLAGCDGDTAEFDENAPRPNIVLITTDDQALDTFTRRVMPETFRLLVDEGTVPEDFTVTTPLCCPSRASLLTGQYGHNNGVLANKYALLHDPESTLPVWLGEAGYHTAHVGKYLNNYEKVEPEVGPAPGWDEWATVVGASYYDYELHLEDGSSESHGDRPRDYLTRVITRQARRTIAESAPASEPLFLQVDYYAPHSDPNDDPRCRDAALPDPRDLDRFTGATLPRPESFDEEDVSDKPAFMQGLAPIAPHRQLDMQRVYGCELASLVAVDRGIREIADALRQAGELDDTVIALMSDNAVMRGQHRIVAGKHVAYEETQRVPVAMRVPRQVLGTQAPARLRGPVANIDLAPTFVGLAGANPCPPDGDCRVMDGRSLVGALDGSDPIEPGRALLVELDESAAPDKFDGPCRYRGLRAGPFFYVEHEIAQDPVTFECVEVSDRELYDLDRDPFQLENLLPPGGADPKAEALAARLGERLEELHDCQGIEGRDPEPPEGISFCD